MSANTFEVTIGSNVYPAFADLATAKVYLAADPSSDAWIAEDDEAESRTLVAATRVLLRQNWITKPDLINDPEAIPQPVIDACCELAMQIANGVDVVNYAATNVQQKLVKAGTVEVQNFRSSTTFQPSDPLPQPAWGMIKPYIAGQGAPSGPRASGTCGRSITLDRYDHTRGI